MSSLASNQSYLSRVINQMGDPAFHKILFKSAMLALICFAFIMLVLGQYWPDEALMESQTGGDSWWEDILSFLAGFGYYLTLAFGLYFLFPALMTMMMGLFLEEVADAVEQRYYPYRLGARKIGIAEGVMGGLALAIKVLSIHFLFLIPYLILALLTGGLGALILITLVNAWAYGQEYFTVAASRHMPPVDAKTLYRENRSDILSSGIVVAGLFLVPFVNILAPVIGVALMTHRTHALLVDNE